MGAFSDVLNVDGSQPAYVPQVGDEIVLRGDVSEFFYFTQLSSPRLVARTGTALDVDALIPPVDADPPAVFDDANTLLGAPGEHAPPRPGRTRSSPTGSTSSRARPTPRCGSSAATARSRRGAGYAQRVFRDAHPLDDLPGLVDNGNGFRILVGALGLKSLGGDNTLLLPPSRTFAPRHQRARRRAQLQLQQVPDRDDGDAVARERDRPGAERAADPPATGRSSTRSGTTTSRTSTTSATIRSTAATSSATPVARVSARRSTTSRPRTPSTRSASG